MQGQLIMSDFKVEVKTSEVFPEVKILKPDPWFDYRGEMWTYWEKENEILPEGNEWKISKFTRSYKRNRVYMWQCTTGFLVK